MEKYKCDRCKRNFTRKGILTRHRNRINQCFISNANDGPSIDITTSKICEKKAGEKRPFCDEIIHFDSDEIVDGEPKSLKTLKKLNTLINKEGTPPAVIKIGMNI